MQVPVHDMGTKAAQVLLDQMLHEQPPDAPVIVPVSLVERESTAPVRPRPPLRPGAGRVT
jgi:DNA-binding LacI/PurR family transcriptional regulator